MADRADHHRRGRRGPHRPVLPTVTLSAATQVRVQIGILLRHRRRGPLELGADRQPTCPQRAWGEPGCVHAHGGRVRAVTEHDHHGPRPSTPHVRNPCPRDRRLLTRFLLARLLDGEPDEVGETFERIVRERPRIISFALLSAAVLLPDVATRHSHGPTGATTSKGTAADVDGRKATGSRGVKTARN